MRIVGHGIDLVEVARIEAILDRHGDRFLARVFTPAEAAQSEGRRGRAEHLAGRFAAKEAVLKALGTGLDSGIAWTEIEVVSSPRGQPTVRLVGRAAAVARDLGIGSWSLSISHTSAQAAASAIAIG